jgi:hypothetical protein
MGEITFSNFCANIGDERHHTYSPIEKGSCNQQAIAEILIGHRDLTQTLLVLDFRREERRGLDTSMRRVRAELRGYVAFDAGAGSKRGINESFLSLSRLLGRLPGMRPRHLGLGGFVVETCYHCSRPRRC